MLLVETEAVAVGTIVTKSQAAAWAFICLKFLWLIARVGVGVTPISQLRRRLTGFQCGPCGPCHAPGGPQRPVPWPPLAMSTAVTGWAEPAASPAPPWEPGCDLRGFGVRYAGAEAELTAEQPDPVPAVHARPCSRQRPSGPGASLLWSLDLGFQTWPLFLANQFSVYELL